MYGAVIQVHTEHWEYYLHQGNSFCLPPILDRKVVNRIVNLDDPEASHLTHQPGNYIQKWPTGDCAKITSGSQWGNYHRKRKYITRLAKLQGCE